MIWIWFLYDYYVQNYSTNDSHVFYSWILEWEDNIICMIIMYSSSSCKIMWQKKMHENHLHKFCICRSFKKYKAFQSDDSSYIMGISTIELCWLLSIFFLVMSQFEKLNYVDCIVFCALYQFLVLYNYCLLMR